MLTPLTAISPVDGRYRNKTEKLADYFSEQALIRYRIRVEVEYFIALCELPLPQLTGIDRSKFAALRALYLDFSDADARRVKEIESVTNHDVKAIEYIIKEKMDTLGLEAYKEFVHFGLTSQDINNTAIPLSIKEALAEVCYPALAELREKLAALADGKDIFYIDINEVFDDENGNLRADASGDSTHVYAKYDLDWCDWLCTKAIVR